jgi:hypothetical protein
MTERICLIGFDQPEIDELKQRLSGRIIAHPTLPGFQVVGGQLLIEQENGGWQVPVDRVVFYGIFENDFDLLVALNLWSGPCFPNPRGMLDCRNKHACLVRALSATSFPGYGRGFVPAGETVRSEQEQVAKWGNWHCGENKTRFSGQWQAENSSTLEPFFPGKAVRVVKVGDECLQIHLEGGNWLKSIHDESAGFMEVDPQLEADTRKLADYFGLEVIANDYIVGDDGQNYLLEVNHIPNVTRFREIWKLYSQLVVNWCEMSTNESERVT